MSKFRIILKDPDGPYDCLTEEVKRQLAAIPDLSADEREELQETRHAKLTDFIGKWMRYGEYLTVEFDTEAGTAVVVENGK